MSLYICLSISHSETDTEEIVSKEPTTKVLAIFL